jgi:hypothetical protein
MARQSKSAGVSFVMLTSIGWAGERPKVNRGTGLRMAVSGLNFAVNGLQDFQRYAFARAAGFVVFQAGRYRHQATAGAEALVIASNHSLPDRFGEVFCRESVGCVGGYIRSGAFVHLSNVDGDDDKEREEAAPERDEIEWNGSPAASAHARMNRMRYRVGLRENDERAVTRSDRAFGGHGRTCPLTAKFSSFITLEVRLAEVCWE